MRKASKSGVWKLCSEYNRRKDADIHGYGKCCSCGKYLHWKEGDAGHFIPRARGKAVYWEPDNIHLQCPGCNRFDVERAKIGYTRFMLAEYGDNRVDELMQQSRTVYRERQADLEEWREFYLGKLAEMNNRAEEA